MKMIKIEDILKILGIKKENIGDKDIEEIVKLLKYYNQSIEDLESYIYKQENNSENVELAVKNMASLIEEEK